MAKSKYYSLERIFKKNADYNIIIGKRSNGKTYNCCDMAINSYLKYGARTAYIRRFAEDITPKNIQNLFLPHNITDLTDNSYNITTYKSRQFRLAYAEDGKVLHTDDTCFCQAFSLNSWERVKGADNGYFEYIIFDEFMSRGQYLPNEFIIFCNVLSSLLRDRAGTKIFMLANTVNKYCPYFAEMGIDKIIPTMEQGEIKTARFGDLKIAIEYCADSENTKPVSKYFNFDNPQLQMITTGKWEIKNYPHLTESITKENIVFKFFIDFDNNFLCGDVCEKHNDIFIHFHHAKREEYKNTDFLFDLSTPYITPYKCQTIDDGTTKAHSIIKSLISRNMCFYSTNEVGEIVRNWILAQRNYNREKVL